MVHPLPRFFLKSKLNTNSNKEAIRIAKGAEAALLVLKSGELSNVNRAEVLKTFDKVISLSEEAASLTTDSAKKNKHLEVAAKAKEGLKLFSKKGH